MTRRPMSFDERSAHAIGQMIPGTLGGRSRIAAPVRSAPNVGAAIGSTTAGGSGTATAAATGFAEHLTAPDPHPQYLLVADLTHPLSYVPLGNGDPDDPGYLFAPDGSPIYVTTASAGLD